MKDGKYRKVGGWTDKEMGRQRHREMKRWKDGGIQKWSERKLDRKIACLIKL